MLVMLCLAAVGVGFERANTALRPRGVQFLECKARDCGTRLERVARRSAQINTHVMSSKGLAHEPRIGMPLEHPVSLDAEMLPGGYRQIGGAFGMRVGEGR